MTDIDLYRVHGLDRSRPPAELAATLTAQLNHVDPRDTLARSRIETARAILGDPARRARYEAALADPAAPALDEPALAVIAGRTVPTAPRPGLAAAFASRQVRVLSAVTAALAVVLVIGITAVACSGGSSHDAAIADRSTQAGSGSPQAGTSKASTECTPVEGVNDYQSTRPDTTIVLTKQTALPSEFSVLSDPQVEVSRSYSTSGGISDGLLTQYQDKNIGLGIKPGNAPFRLAVFRPDGSLVSNTAYPDSRDLPKPFDLALTANTGYYRISAAHGVTIPPAAAGTQQDQNFALEALPDAFDKTTVWVLLRGGSALYKGTMYANPGEKTCTGE